MLYIIRVNIRNSRLSRNMRQFKENCALKTVERYGTVDDVKIRIKDGKVSLTWR